MNNRGFCISSLRQASNLMMDVHALIGDAAKVADDPELNGLAADARFLFVNLGTYISKHDYS